MKNTRGARQREKVRSISFPKIIIKMFQRLVLIFEQSKIMKQRRWRKFIEGKANATKETFWMGTASFLSSVNTHTNSPTRRQHHE